MEHKNGSKSQKWRVIKLYDREQYTPYKFQNVETGLYL